MENYSEKSYKDKLEAIFTRFPSVQKGGFSGGAVLGAGLILAHSAAMVLWPVAFLLPYYFRATGRAAFTMFVAIFAMALFRVGLAYVFVKLMGKNVLWVWYAMFADWIFRVISRIAAPWQERLQDSR